MLDWASIETVFLDMDGTLLDLHFDNYFWLEHVPRRYAAKEGIPLRTARRDLLERYARVEGTMEWYCLDYWTRELGLDIPVLKEEVDHLVALHPFVVEFLNRVRAMQKRVLLVTNAHGRSIELKMRKTRLGEHLDGVISSHCLGLPKEEREFWKRLRETEPFDPERTLLIDDSVPVLEAARDYGVRYLLAVRKPDSRRPEKPPGEFPSISTFRDIHLPEA